jgi:hypothetical protein
MQLPRPVIQQFIRPGDPITADFLNQMVGLAGYFQGQPVDAVMPGESIYVGRPAFMRVASGTYPSTSITAAWVGGYGRIYGLNNAIVMNGNTSADYDAIPTDDNQYPGICLTEINGGNFAEVGDYVMAYPMQTPSGQVFAFLGTRSRLYRVTMPNVLIANRKWSYTLIPQTCGSDGVTWSDDPYGQTLTGAMNEAEALNTAGDTIQGNDIDFSQAPFGTDPGTLAKVLQPIKEHRLVEITRFTTVTSGSSVTSTVAWFNAANVVQEGCIA